MTLSMRNGDTVHFDSTTPAATQTVLPSLLGSAIKEYVSFLQQFCNRTIREINSEEVFANIPVRNLYSTLEETLESREAEEE